MSEDEVFRSSLSEDVELSGYNFCSLSLIPDSNLAGVVVDLDTCDLKEARGNLRRVGVRRHQLPIIFATRKKDFDACLNVVRAGGDILISKPVTADNLIREFERIEVTKKITPFRVLIVENNSTSSSDNRIGTEQTAFVMDYLHDPERLLNKLASFHPELILVDFEFPRYTGLELARMVWQSEDFTNMPVLFKCSDYEACRKAYKAGLYDGDLLTEPLTPERFFLPLHGE